MSIISIIRHMVGTSPTGISSGGSGPEFKELSLSGITKMIAYGDSYVQGGAWVDNNDRFVVVFSNNNSLSLTNNGSGGTGLFTAATFASMINPANNNSDTCIVVNAGLNSVRFEGDTGKVYEEIRTDMTSILANTIIGNTLYPSGGSVTKSGTWTNTNTSAMGGKGGRFLGQQGIRSNTNNDYLECTLSGDKIVISYINSADASLPPGTFEIYVDSVLKQTVTTDHADVIGLPGDTLYHPGAIVLKNLGVGSHTVRIRNISSNYVIIDYLAEVKTSGYMPAFVMLIPHLDAIGYASGGAFNKANDSIVNAANDEIKSVVSDIFPEFPITCVDSNRTFDPLTDLWTDHVHRNTSGNLKMAQEMQLWVQ